MGALLIVKGTIETGRLADFGAAAREFAAYRRDHGLTVPGIYHGLSGAMNTVAMLFRYPSLAALEQEFERERDDRRYAQVASRMPYVPGTIVYEPYLEHPDAG